MAIFLKSNLIICRIVLFFLINIYVDAFAQKNNDSLLHKHSVKLDFVPFYHVLFDSRFQLRGGIEYERQLSEKISFALYLDAGLYDKYDFIKYYDFFNQNQGLYSIKQTVSITGFHLLPSCNYYFFSFRKKPHRKFFSSAVVDFGYYHKKISIYNSLTSEKSSDNYNQARLGAGMGCGFRNNFSKHFLYELKTSVIAKAFNYISEDGRTPIKSLDSQWTSSGYDFWWISNLKIGYVF